jgi:hypothetical protein
MADIGATASAHAGYMVDFGNRTHSISHRIWRVRMLRPAVWIGRGMQDAETTTITQNASYATDSLLPPPFGRGEGGWVAVAVFSFLISRFPFFAFRRGACFNGNRGNRHLTSTNANRGGVSVRVDFVDSVDSVTSASASIPLLRTDDPPHRHFCVLRSASFPA